MADDTPELWTIQQVAAHLDISHSGARATLSRWGLHASQYQRTQGGGPARALYSAAEVRRLATARPGQGARTDLT